MDFSLLVLSMDEFLSLMPFRNSSIVNLTKNVIYISIFLSMYKVVSLAGNVDNSQKKVQKKKRTGLSATSDDVVQLFKHLVQVKHFHFLITKYQGLKCSAFWLNSSFFHFLSAFFQSDFLLFVFLMLFEIL